MNEPMNQPPAAPGGAQPTAPGAVSALVTGLIGLLICAPVGIAAIILGGKAQQRIAESNGYYGGDGMALAGKILGWVAVALFVIGIVVTIILFATGSAWVSNNNNYGMMGLMGA